MNHRNKWRIILICSIFLSSLGVLKAEGDDYIKNIEIAESSIKIDHQEFPPVAYLCLTLKNNGDRKIYNIAFEITYYGKEGDMIMKAVVKNALNDPLPDVETRKYKVRLGGDVVNERNEKYPYSQADAVAEFDIKIRNVKFALR